MFELNQKRAVITGGGSGIGRAIALLFARQGAQVQIVDVSDEACSTVAAEIHAAGGEAQAHPCDVTQQAAVQEEFLRNAHQLKHDETRYAEALARLF